MRQVTRIVRAATLGFSAFFCFSCGSPDGSKRSTSPTPGQTPRRAPSLGNREGQTHLVGSPSPSASSVQTSEENDHVLILAVEKEVKLRRKGSQTDENIYQEVEFHSGDLLKVGVSAAADILCLPHRICRLSQGEYTTCCTNLCQTQNSWGNETPEETTGPKRMFRIYRSKDQLPPDEKTKFVSEEEKIRAIKVKPVVTQYLITNLYGNWGLRETSSELEKLSGMIENQQTKTQLGQAYVPMVRRVGDLQQKVDQKNKAIIKYQEVITQAVPVQQEERAAAHESLGKIYSESGKQKEAEANLQKAKTIYQTTGNIKKVAELNQVVKKTSSIKQ